MAKPRSTKPTEVADVIERLERSTATVVTEYRGLSVAEMASLRRELRAAGGEYKVVKNTLAKRAIDGTPNEALAEHLSGPTAIAFVTGDVSAVAKALKNFAKANPNLIIKGGIFEGSPLDAAGLSQLADLPSRDVLLAQLAGALVAPLSTLAGLLQALPRDLAYGLKALADKGGAAPAAEAPAAEEAPAEAPAPEAAAEEAPAEASAEAAVEEAPAEEAPAAEAPEATEDAPTEEAPAAAEDDA